MQNLCGKMSAPRAYRRFVRCDRSSRQVFVYTHSSWVSLATAQSRTWQQIQLLARCSAIIPRPRSRRWQLGRSQLVFLSLLLVFIATACRYCCCASAQILDSSCPASAVPLLSDLRVLVALRMYLSKFWLFNLDPCLRCWSQKLNHRLDSIVYRCCSS